MFALSSKAVCAWNDEEATHVQFYITLLEMLNGDSEEKDEVKDLLAWWDK